MDALAHISWRIYPASALIALGAVLALWGTRVEVRGLRHILHGTERVIAFIWGFRLSVIGLALAGVGAAWLWHQMWLLVLSLAIGGEETLESSIHLYAVRLGQRMEGRATR